MNAPPIRKTISPLGSLATSLLLAFPFASFACSSGEPTDAQDDDFSINTGVDPNSLGGDGDGVGGASGTPFCETADCGQAQCNEEARKCECAEGQVFSSVDKTCVSFGECMPTLDSGSFKFDYTRDDDRFVFCSTYAGAGAIDQVSLNGEILSEGDATTGYELVDGVVKIIRSDLAPSKYSVLIRTDQPTEAPLFAPIWIGDGVAYKDFKWTDASIYQIVVDRFVDGDPTNNAVSSDGASLGVDQDEGAEWYGGDFQGVIDKLDYIQAMGLNTLYLSSPISSTNRAHFGKDYPDKKYSGFHMYWPTGSGYTYHNDFGIVEPIEPRLGTQEKLKELVNEAHRRGIRVLVDNVANHVHEDSPIYTAKPEFFRTGNVCAGSAWDEDGPRQACLFDLFLPDWDYTKPEAISASVDHALWMIREFNLDGFRVDAAKHMEDAFFTELRRRTKLEIEGVTEAKLGEPVQASRHAEHFYTVGESFTGDKYLLGEKYVGEDKLTGQFEFHMFDAAIGVLSADEGFLGTGDFGHLKDHADANDTYYQSTIGPNALMANFLGNHDKERILSYALGLSKAAWGNSSGNDQSSGDSFGFDKLRNALGFLFTSPNILSVYMGDEYGMPGGADPDNRRVVMFDVAGEQAKTLELTRALGTVRAAHEELRIGTRETVIDGSDHWVYGMTANGKTAVIALELGDGRNVDVGLDLSAHEIAVGNCTVSGSSLTVPARGVCVLVQQ